MSEELLRRIYFLLAETFMHIIIFAWEYPPRIIGRLSTYVKNLSNQLATNKVDVYVITYADTFSSRVDDVTGVKIIGVPNPVRSHPGLLTWVLTLNQEIERAAANVFYDSAKQVELINVYDWHFVPAAVALKEGLGIPFLYSVDSLEDHRSKSANMPFNMAIKSLEWLGFFEASLISVKSDWMRDEVARIYHVPKEKIRTFPTDPDGAVLDIPNYVTSIEEIKN